MKSMDSDKESCFLNRYTYLLDNQVRFKNDI